MASYAIRQIQNTIVVISDLDPTEVSLVPINGTETDYFINPSTDALWKRTGDDVTGYSYTSLGGLGGANVVDTLAATLGAGNQSGAFDLKMAAAQKIWVDQLRSNGTNKIAITDFSTFGFAQMTTAQRDLLVVTGLEDFFIYNTDTHTLQFYNGTSWADVGSGLSAAGDVVGALTQQQIFNTGLAVGGNINFAIAAVATDTTLDNSYYTVLVDASGGAVVISLPLSSSVGRIYNIKKIDSAANSVTILPDAGNGDLIDGDASLVFSGKNQIVTVQADGAAWNVISNSQATDNLLHNAAVGINGAPESGIAFKVTGGSKFIGNAQFGGDIFTDVASLSTIQNQNAGGSLKVGTIAGAYVTFDEAAGTAVITAAGGTTISNDLNTDSIKNKTNELVLATTGNKNIQIISDRGIDLTQTDVSRNLEFNLTGGLIMNTKVSVTKTLAQAIIDGDTIVNGIICAP